MRSAEIEQLRLLMDTLEAHAHSEEEFQKWLSRLPPESASIVDRYNAAVALGNEIIPPRAMSARLEVALLQAVRDVLGPSDQREAALQRLAEVVEQVDGYLAYIKRMKERKAR